jgi:hypothetical protein
MFMVLLFIFNILISNYHMTASFAMKIATHFFIHISFISPEKLTIDTNIDRDTPCGQTR